MKSTTLGVFLHRIPYSETSLIVDFYTEEFGRKSFLFKGGKKKAHALFPMSLCEIEYYGRQESKLLNLTTVNSVSSSIFHLDPIKSTVTFFMAEVIRKSFKEEEHDTIVFDALNELIVELDRTDNSAVFPIKFLVELSEIIGIQPFVETAHLNNPYFDIEEGTIRNGVIKSTDENELESIKLIAELCNGSFNNSTQKRGVRELALDLMLKYFETHVANFDKLVCYDIIKEVLKA